MSTTGSSSTRISKWIKASVTLMVFLAGVAILMMWLVGMFKPKIKTDGVHAGEPRSARDVQVIEVTAKTMLREETAVGSIQPVHRVEVASRLLARAVEVGVSAGQKIEKDQVLVRLEDTDLKARLAQTQSATSQAQAALDQARSEEARMRAAFEKNAVAALEMDRATNALKGAEANLARLKQAQTEAETILAYATIRSPIAGTIVDKRVNAGDTVSPGQVVVTLLDPTRMQMVASVRESLSRRLVVGGTVSVKVDVLDHACSGIVSEIVPEAEGSSRTFQVKVTGPCPEGVYAGMFGRISIPVGDETVLLVPRNAVRTVGQVDCVDVVQGDVLVRRAVRLGRVIDEQLEVLSGLTAGEMIAVAKTGGR